MVKQVTAERVAFSGSLAEEEKKLVAEVLCLYREGGSFTSITEKLRRLRAIREEMRKLEMDAISTRVPV